MTYQSSLVSTLVGAWITGVVIACLALSQRSPSVKGSLCTGLSSGVFVVDSSELLLFSSLLHSRSHHSSEHHLELPVCVLPHITSTIFHFLLFFHQIDSSYSSLLPTTPHHNTNGFPLHFSSPTSRSLSPLTPLINSYANLSSGPYFSRIPIVALIRCLP